MNAQGVESLLLKAGEEPTAAHLQRLDAAIQRIGNLGGRNVRRRVLPWGTHMHTEGGGSTYVSPYFEPRVSRAGEMLSIAWKRGLIGGVEPTIGGVPISGNPDTREIPRFETKAQFNEVGEMYVYFRLFLTRTWTIEKIEPHASATVPLQEAWRADLLSVILFESGAPWRALVSNQGYLATNRRDNGRALHLFWMR